jgi:hypothetical protein
MFRPMMFVRIVEPVHGKPHIRMRFKPTVDHGTRLPTLTLGGHHVSFALPEQGRRLTTDASLAALTEERATVLEAPLAFLIGPDESVVQQPQARSVLEQTERYWHE